MIVARCTVETDGEVKYDYDIDLSPYPTFIFVDITNLWMDSQVEDDYLIAVF